MLNCRMGAILTRLNAGVTADAIAKAFLFLALAILIRGAFAQTFLS